MTRELTSDYYLPNSGLAFWESQNGRWTGPAELGGQYSPESQEDRPAINVTTLTFREVHAGSKKRAM